MRVLMLGWEFPPAITGGLGVASEGLVEGLLTAGARVTLVLPRDPGPVAVAQPGLTVLDASAFPFREARAAPKGMRRPGSAYAPARPWRRPARSARERFSSAADAYGPDLVSEVLRFAEAAGRIARRERFDVIHAHDWLTFLAGLEARRVSGRPLVVHVHATELDRAGNLDNRFVRDIEAMGVRLADRVIAVSNATALRLAEVYGVPPSRLTVVHNALGKKTKRRRRRRPLARRRSPLVLFAGRVTWQKGPGLFLEAAARVARELPRARFVVAGAGDLLPAMIARARSLGIGRKVSFPGFVPEAALDRLYGEADVFVSPSASEPFGLAALEAVAHGTPAIVSRNAGVTEVVASVLRVDFADVEDLADKITTVLKSPKLARAFAARGRAEARRLSWGRAARECLRIYGEILGPGTRADAGNESESATARRRGRTTPRTSPSSRPRA
ncbi:MAG: glycosyltransferase family 4 protein [Thermoanaerobaculia bacterium]